MAESPTNQTGSSSPKGMERRKHERHAVHFDALFYNREHFAEIIDISRSGVGCRCLVESDVFNPVLERIDLLDCKAGNYVTGLSCRRIRRGVPRQIPRYGHYRTQNCFFEFVGLDSEQSEEIDRFIEGCSSSV